MHKNVSAEEMLSAIDDGWYPVWFAVENSTLTVDLCVNYRLTDGKVLFLQFYSTDSQELSRVTYEVAKKAKENWNKALDEMTGKITEQIDEVTQTEKNIASVQWKEKQKYLMTYFNGEKETYECTCSEDSDIYMQKIPDENEQRYNFFNKQKNVREVVFSSTKIELID